MLYTQAGHDDEPATKTLPCRGSPMPMGVIFTAAGASRAARSRVICPPPGAADGSQHGFAAERRSLMMICGVLLSYFS